MYEVDDQDEVTELTSAPRPDIGAPLPLVLADEHHLLLAYLISEPNPTWDGGSITLVSPESDGLAIAIIRFHWASAHLFGSPNDEAFDGHPLASRGLRPYRVFEVRQSSWIRKLERMNSVHPHHNRQRFLPRRPHFVFDKHQTRFGLIGPRSAGGNNSVVGRILLDKLPDIV